MKPPPPAHPDDATDTADTADTTVTTDTTTPTDTTLLDALRATLLAADAPLSTRALPLDAPALVRVFIAALLGEAWRHELTAAAVAGRAGGDATAGDDALSTVISILAAAGRDASLDNADNADNGDGGLACDSEGGPA
jgi:hypothetical protein